MEYSNRGLGDNPLQELEPSPTPLSALKTLNISSNELITIDVTCMPSLRSLNLDQNSINHIKGLQKLKKLETLCWRDQNMLSDPEFPALRYQDSHNIHTLYLSRNVLSTFSLPAPFLDLHNLSLASTGLKTLLLDFGHKLPNLRILNLNYNALRDLRPLQGILKLQKLFVAGNRISRLRQTAAVLEGLGEAINEVDLRRNPLTVGFYTPQIESRHPSTSMPSGERLRMVKVQQEADSSERDDQQHKSIMDSFIEIDQGDLLPPVDREADTITRQRLDQDTMLRRRVYEILVMNACPHSLQILDGMNFARESVGLKDQIWERLMELGILGADTQQSEERGEKIRRKKKTAGRKS